mmetsp:Transcript_26387/g.74270  ORF Transcript_26387/g.74270 Transcript_26387/m.74270 type:complete len:103 (+) Transcript_26387:117-425(+)
MILHRRDGEEYLRQDVSAVINLCHPLPPHAEIAVKTLARMLGLEDSKDHRAEAVQREDSLAGANGQILHAWQQGRKEVFINVLAKTWVNCLGRTFSTRPFAL